MLHIVLQIWGGVFFLLNKMFFSRAERSSSQSTRDTWRVWSWVMYLVGLPAWFIIFVRERNWMVLAVEAGGAMSVLLGLALTIRGLNRDVKWLDWVARVAASIGVLVSFYDVGGLTRFSQFLELGSNGGFLVGVYLIARQRPKGYIYFLLMHASMGTLLAVQGYLWLVIQQAASFGFVFDAYVTARRRAA